MKLLNNIELYVTQLFENILKFEYTYHTIQHTKNVVNAVQEISQYEKITSDELELLIIAAWFHDTGYTVSKENHEIESTKIATKFLKENGVDEERIQDINKLILATIFNYQPKSLLEKIICDADFYHLSNDDYETNIELLREEWKLEDLLEYSDIEWIKININFLENKHDFKTDFAKKNWQFQKEKNINKLKEKLKQLESMENNKDEKKKKKKDSKKLGRGVETLFKVTINNHTRLSDIADSKANLLLSVNAIIISVTLSVLIPKLDSPGNSYLSIPTFILLFFSVVCIIFAILATRPKVTTSDFTKEDLVNKKVNLLFFGNFYKVPYEDFQEEIDKMMFDNDYLYSSMTRDLHYLGIILDKKYKLLRITYNIFMVGIIISVLAFIFAINNA